jgi:hypothetical protein
LDADNHLFQQPSGDVANSAFVSGNTSVAYSADAAGSAQASSDLLAGASAGQIPEQDRPPANHIEDVNPVLEDLRIAQQFVRAVNAGTLAEEPLPPEVIKRLLDPIQTTVDIDSMPGLRLSLDIYLAVSNASEQTYHSVRDAIIRAYPNSEVLSYDRVKKVLTEITGVTSMIDDMCPNSCHAYTGPFSSLDACHHCSEARYDPAILAASNGKRRVPRLRWETMPIGPQLQVIPRSVQGSEHMSYLERRMDEIRVEIQNNHGHLDSLDDFCCGREFTSVWNRKVGSRDFVVWLSLDGMQLYQSKQSDCWVYIWVIGNFCPELRYKRTSVIIGGIIPGPNKPKNLDSFLLPGLRHLAALQKEGLRVWDARLNEVYTSYVLFAFGTADTPGVAYLTGLAGHQAMFPCRTFCDTQGRRKEGGKHYYPAHLKPNNYHVEGCDHPDKKIEHLPRLSSAKYQELLSFVLASSNNTEYEFRRKITGISKPSIINGLVPERTLIIPGCFSHDIMHLNNFNLFELHMDLWRAVIDCDSSDDRSTWRFAALSDAKIWKEHGAFVADARPYLPGCFDHAPRNIAEKINSGYKAKEGQTYFYGLAPALLLDVLEDEFYRNFCKLVMGVRILEQRRITHTQLQNAHQLLIEFTNEFEKLYYERREDRIHFCRPCIHAVPHLAPETARVGPLAIISQWLLERVIGLLGSEIKQHSNPYANLSQRALRWCQVNALKSLVPSLNTAAHATEYKAPHGAYDAGGGYYLLRAREKYPKPFTLNESASLWRYAGNPNITALAKYRRWARVRLPNGQIARSAWRELVKQHTNIRISRNVKV